MIELADVADAREILDLQILAYQSEAALYPGTTIPPMVQTLEQMQADFARQMFLKLVCDGRIIGSVRAYLQEGTCFVGRLVVHPDYRNRGLGSALVCEIERRFEQAERFELFTGERSTRNLRLYQRLGYRPFRSERVTEHLTLVYMEKLKRQSEGECS